MFTDQLQYLRCMQVMSDLICFALLYLIVVPTLIVAGSDCSFLSSDTIVTAAADTCIYKSFLYAAGTGVILLVASAASAAITGILPFDADWPKVFLATPLFLCLANSAGIWSVHIFFSSNNHPMLLIQAWAGACLFLLLILNRLNILLLMQKNRSHPFLIRHVVVAGTGKKSMAMARYILDHPRTGLRFKGFLTTDTVCHWKSPDGDPVLGTVADLPALVHNVVMDTVLVPDPDALDGQLDFLFRTCATMGIEMGCAQPLPGVDGSIDPAVEPLNGIHLFLYSFVNIKPLSAFAKRLFDFTGSGILILLCLPFWVVVPLMIKSSSKGPVFFRQERVGKSGRRFILYKFRSMHENAEAMQADLLHLNEMDGPAFKIKDDPRQTPTGRVLRKYSLDELPQLFNVLKGEISLVGPRPAMADEVRQYRPAERRRLSVIQGITCVWQVSGRNEIKFDEWMKLDLMYIDHWSSISDFKILYKTIPAVLMKRGAY